MCAARPRPRPPGAALRRTAWAPRPTSMPHISAGMSSASARSPIASTRRGSAPAPPLWPGTCSRAGSRSAKSRSASRYGVSDWEAGIAGESRSGRPRRLRPPRARRPPATPSIDHVPSADHAACRPSAPARSRRACRNRRRRRSRRPRRAPRARCAPRPAPSGARRRRTGSPSPRSEPGRIPTVVPPALASAAAGGLHRPAESAADQHGPAFGDEPPDLGRGGGRLVAGADDGDVAQGSPGRCRASTASEMRA